MKFLRIAFISAVSVGLFTVVFAAGEAEKGKALFNDPTFAGGVKACSSCHPDGEGLEEAGDKEEFHIAGKNVASLEEAINRCIVYAIKGKAIDPESDQMKEMVAYIRSLKAK